MRHLAYYRANLPTSTGVAYGVSASQYLQSVYCYATPSTSMACSAAMFCTEVALMLWAENTSIELLYGAT
eukprot:3435167-Rhodomonas_salina.1